MSLSFGLHPAKPPRRGHPGSRATPRRFTAAEDAAIIAGYSSVKMAVIGRQIGRSQGSVASRARLLVTRGLLNPHTRLNLRPWTQAETAQLREWYGENAVADIAQTLGRSENAVRVRAKRLHLDVRGGFLTARQVADILGVDSHTPCRWARAGLLSMHRTDTLTAHGTARLWACRMADLEAFVRRCPEMVEPSRVEAGFWRNLAEQAHRKADFLSIDEAAVLLGVSAHCVRAHVLSGQVPGVHAPKLDRGGRRRLLIRRRDLARFMAYRPELLHHKGRSAKVA